MGWTDRLASGLQTASRALSGGGGSGGQTRTDSGGHEHDVGGGSGRADSLVNALSRFGDPDVDRSQANVVEKMRRIPAWERNELYDHNNIAGRIIDTPPEDCTSKGWDVEVGTDAIDSEQLGDFEDQLGLPGQLKQADIWSRLHGGGIVLLGVADGRPMDAPVDFDRVESVEFAQHVSSENAEIDEIEDDVQASTPVGEPRMFTIESDVLGQEFRDGEQLDWHRDRVLMFRGTLPDHDHIDEYEWWGVDEMTRVWTELSNYIMSVMGVGDSVHSAIQPIWKTRGLKQKFDNPSEDAIQAIVDRIAGINASRSMLGMMLMDMENEEFDQVSRDVSGQSTLYETMLTALSVVTGFPKVKLSGGAPTGLSTDDKAGRHNWNQKMGSRQSTLYTPLLRKFHRLVVAAVHGIDLERSESIDVLKFNFETIIDKPETDKKSEDAKLAKSLVALNKQGLIGRDEARRVLRNKTWTFGPEVIQDVERDDLTPTPELPKRFHDLDDRNEFDPGSDTSA